MSACWCYYFEQKNDLGLRWELLGCAKLRFDYKLVSVHAVSPCKHVLKCKGLLVILSYFLT